MSQHAFHYQAQTYDLLLRLRAARMETDNAEDFYQRAAPIADEAQKLMKELSNRVAAKLAEDTRNLATGLEVYGPFDTERLHDIANSLERIARS